MAGREEQDSLGVVTVPEEAYWGAQTQRAKDNFPVSGLTMPPTLLAALAQIKEEAAAVNAELGLIPLEVARAIRLAAGEVVEHLATGGPLSEQFPIDVFQTGSATSTNMNMNEVIASRANEILTGRMGGKEPVHPNDHVNHGQSSNDVMPTALHLAALTGLTTWLDPALAELEKSLSAKSRELKGVMKIGRTHLQDAVPLSLGQEFSGYARQVTLSRERVKAAGPGLAELALGGTAVGTGMNAHPEFAPHVIGRLAKRTGLPFVEAENHFEAQAARDAAVFASGALKAAAASLTKIANDIRWLGSGPRAGLGEINLPGLQPGSSIMPGKVNPVIPEAVIQACAQVVAADTAIGLGGLGGYFELNTMIPLIAHNLLTAIDILANSARILAEKCVDGLTANTAKCESNIERSLAMATPLAPVIGYDQAAAVAKQAYKEDKTVREAALEMGVMGEEKLEELLGKRK